MMETSISFLMALAAIFLVGILTDMIGRRSPLPRVTLLLIFGVIIGPHQLNFIPVMFTEQFELITNLALVLVGFLLGGRLTAKSVNRCATAMVVISLAAALGTTLMVAVGMILCGVSVGMSILLGCLAAATDPAATVDVITEQNATGEFPRILTGVVAMDDAWGLVIFSVGLVVVGSGEGNGGSFIALFEAGRELGCAVLLGIALGVPAAKLTGRFKPGQPIITEALGLVFLCGGLALWLEVSFLVAAMVMGVVVANLARHHSRPFHAIEGVEGPILVLFFVVAGASFDLDSMAQIGQLGVLYLVLRSCGKVAGGWLGGSVCRCEPLIRRWIGVALLPQAGVAIGMALVAAHKYPEYGQDLLTVVIGSTVIFEVVGPILTRLSLKKTQCQIVIE